MSRLRFRVSNPLVAIGCGQFALSLMQAMFMFYYVKVYLNVFHVPHYWFNMAQVLFMVWNAINDPLFGYLQDSPGSWLNSRTDVIRYFAPFLVISFIFVWFPWSTEGSAWEGIHLIVSLFFYDAFYSAVGVAWSALFADSTKEPRMRVSAMKYSQISILLSVNIIAVTEKLSHSLEELWIFQLITVAVAVFGCICMFISGSLQLDLPLTRLKDSKNIFANHNETDNLLAQKTSPIYSVLSMSREVIKEKDFIIIIASNFIHTARSITHMNFASIATELLIPQEVLPNGSLRLSIFYGLLTLGPQILLILNEHMIVRYGAHGILSLSYSLSVLSSFIYILSSNVYITMVFMLIDSITVHSAGPLFNIIISDFIDDDARRNTRRSPISSLVFSLNALFVKPAQSIAPVIIVFILNNYGYQEYLVSKVPSSGLVNAMRKVLFAIPLILGALQSFYSMLLLVTVVADKLRATIPCLLLSLSMIPFATISVGIGGLSWLLPRKAFQKMDNILYRAYMRMCLFVFENISGVQLELFGDVEQMKLESESVLALANHQSNVDWVVMVMLAARQGERGSDAGFRVMVKQAIHYVPLFGWYIFQHGYIYVRRFGDFVGGPVVCQLKWLDTLDEKFWLLIFPEGTRYSRKKMDKIEASKEFCRHIGRKEFNNVLCPRAGGIHMVLDRLKSVDVVYDVTIGYGQTRLPGRRGLAPNMLEFCCGPPDGRTLCVYVRRFIVNELPKNKDQLREWIITRYEEKERLLDGFYELGVFPRPVSLLEPSFSIIHTLPSTLFFTSALIAPFFIPEVRKVYIYTVASFPLLIMWLKIRKCV